MPMFPLGTVLVPHAALPLHVFEARYRVLVFDCLRADREFGVVLIERGSEVGGADQRFDVATVARIVEAHELPDGRWYLLTVGTRRIDVVRWLPDDPYPVALVDDRPDPPWPAPPDPGPAPASGDRLAAPSGAASGAPSGDLTAGPGDDLANAERAVRRALALTSRS